MCVVDVRVIHHGLILTFLQLTCMPLTESRQHPCLAGVNSVYFYCRLRRCFYRLRRRLPSSPMSQGVTDTPSIACQSCYDVSAKTPPARRRPDADLNELHGGQMGVLPPSVEVPVPLDSAHGPCPTSRSLSSKRELLTCASFRSHSAGAALR